MKDYFKDEQNDANVEIAALTKEVLCCGSLKSHQWSKHKFALHLKLITEKQIYDFYDFCRLCSTLILLNVRLNGISHLLVHNNELQTAQKEKTTKLRIHLLKNIIVTKIILQEKFWEDRTIYYKNYHKYETKLRKWEVYYSIYWKLMLNFCRTIFENPFGFNATALYLYTKTNNLEIQ